MSEPRTEPRVVIRGPATPWWKRLARLGAVALALVLMFLVVVTPLDIKAQAILGASVFTLMWALNRFEGRFVTLVLMFVSIAVSSRYMHWRLTATLDMTWSPGMVFGMLLLAAEAYTYVALLLGYAQTAWPLQRKPAPLPADTSSWPTVDVFIPTYNEPLKVVRATVLAAQAMDWPADKLCVTILDDGRRGEFRAFAANAHVGYIARTDNAHAKAGNINHALAKTRGEFVAIFDCDHVPTRSFLQTTMGWFLADRKMAMVQTPHHFYSPDPFERNLGSFRRVPNEGQLFYGLLQPGNDLWNAAFFCGSCAVMRRTALLQVGGIAVETVTEDAHTALRMHRRGWRTAFLGVPQASGLATESLSAHIGQRIRWARGMVQIFRIDNPLLGRGLKLFQRLCYANAMIYFFNAIPRLVFLTAPLAFLFFGAHIFNAAPALVLAYALPHLAHGLLTNGRTQGRFRHMFWGEIYDTALAFYIVIPTTVAMISPRHGTFNVTAKGGLVERQYFDWKIAAPLVVLLALNVAGIVAGGVALAVEARHLDSVLINVFWASVNIVVLGATLAVALEQRQVREATRVPVQLPGMLRLPSGHTVQCRTEDLSMGGARVRTPAPVELQPEDGLSLSLLVNDEEYPLAAQLVRREDNLLRLRFEALTLEEEAWLVRVLFSRANAWTGWSEAQRQDHPLLAFPRFAGYGARALARMVTGGRRDKLREAA